MRPWFCLVSSLCLVYSVYLCPSDKGGGVCPTENTCCLLDKANATEDSTRTGCVPSDLGSNLATCCDDGVSACGVGYECDGSGRCTAENVIHDPLVLDLPRYRLCRWPSDPIGQSHGYPVDGEFQMMYYSTHGDLVNLTLDDAKKIRAVVVAIHGANRNADDYFCTTSVTRKQQRPYAVDEVVVVAPRFPLIGDTDLDISGTPLQWSDDGAGGPWRYGQDSTNAPFSSFACIDLLLTHLRETLPDLERVSVVGHSAGGQFVQRWALLTDVWDSRFHGIVLNPSSYAYLTPFRYDSGSKAWKLPALDDASNCFKYNSWEWGLELDHDNPTPYFTDTLNSMSMEDLVERFSRRHVVYLAGTRDVCTVPGSENGWCSSHGLETTCMDMAQGANRWERSLNFVRSLSLLHMGHHQTWMSVPGVGHDHSLMFNSREGIHALYHSESYPQNFPIGSDGL